MTIIELLDTAKTRANIPSDYALAKVLGIDRSFISAWRKGRSHPSDEDAVKLATLAGIDEMQVIALIHYETATTPKKKEFWHTFLERRGIAACLTMTALACSIALTPEPAKAGILHLQNYDETARPADNRNIHYAKYATPQRLLILRAIFLKFAACLTSRFSPNVAAAV